MKKNASLLSVGFMIASSILGLLLVFLLIAYSPIATQTYFWRKPLFGAVFLLLCAAGSLVAVSPKHCSMAHGKRKTVETIMDKGSRMNCPPSSEGHHPACGKFIDHTIRFRGTSRCAACTGLLIGGIVAMTVCALYFFSAFNSSFFSIPALMVGFIGLGLGFMQFKLRKWARSAANLLFVLGASFVLIAVDQLAGNVFVDLYVTSLIVLWILTRVMISQLDHQTICESCGFLCVTNLKVDPSPRAPTT